MARILFMSSKEKGHVNPLLPVAQELLRRGHHVGWRCLPFAPPRLGELGIDVEPSAAADDSEGEALATGGPELVELVRDNDRLLRWIRTLLIDQVPGEVDPTREAFRRWEPDLLVVDPMMYQGIIAAHLDDVLYACVSSSLNPVTPDDLDCRHSRNMQAIDADRRRLFSSYGMEPVFKVADCLSPHLNIVFTTKEYVGRDTEIPEATHLVGPTRQVVERGDEPQFDWDLLDGRPLIYASFGSQIYHQSERFQLIADATRELDVQLVVSCGALATSQWAKSLPEHVIARPYVPQRALLEHTSLMITHGGANSMMEAIAAGVPILISSVCNDQPMQAYFACRRGVAKALDLDDAKPEEVRRALSSMLASNSPQRQAVNEMAALYSEIDGAEVAAGLIEELLE